MGRRSPLLPGQQRGDVALDLVRVGVRRPANSPRHPGNMGVHRAARASADIKLSALLRDGHNDLRQGASCRSGSEALRTGDDRQWTAL
jgi:hypothetical protein